MKRRLREAHLANWTSFLVSAESMKDQVAQRNTVLEDAMSRVELSEESPGSPMMLSPVSPRPGSSRFQPSPPPPPKPHNAQLPQPLPPYIRPSKGRGMGAPRNGLDSRRLNNSPNQREERYSSYSERNYLPSPFPENPEMSKLLWMKGYKLESRWSASEACRGRCGLCEDETSPLALLLKAKPSDCATEGDFPAPQSHQQIIYPMAMYNFPETDVISSFLCCEKCAYFVRRLGFSPLDDKITGAIPLISNSEGQNRRIKLQEIDVVLEGRFDTTILDQIFLSLLYEKLDDVIKTELPGTYLFAKALRWEAKNLASTVLLHTELSTCFDSPQETVGKESLSWAMSSQLQKVAPTVSMDLLRYPVGGFVTLLKGYLDDDRVFQAEDIVMKAVFQRLLFYLAEQQFDLREQIGLELARQELGRVLSGESGGLVVSRFRAEVEALEGTYLLEPDAVESFRRLQPWFGIIERDCAPAIRLFLQLMTDLTWQDGSAEEILSLISLFDKGCDLLDRPWTLDEDTCRKMKMS